MENLISGDVLDTVRIVDKNVESGSRIINLSDLTDNDVTVDELPRHKRIKRAQSDPAKVSDATVDDSASVEGQEVTPTEEA